VRQQQQRNNQSQHILSRFSRFLFDSIRILIDKRDSFVCLQGEICIAVYIPQNLVIMEWISNPVRKTHFS
jgi:hypothetical protein